MLLDRPLRAAIFAAADSAAVRGFVTRYGMRLGARRFVAGENVEQFMPVAKKALTATDVMVTASGLLRAADLAAFELGMWQGWTGR